MIAHFDKTRNFLLQENFRLRATAKGRQPAGTTLARNYRLQNHSLSQSGALSRTEATVPPLNTSS